MHAVPPLGPLDRRPLNPFGPLQSPPPTGEPTPLNPAGGAAIPRDGSLVWSMPGGEDAVEPNVAPGFASAGDQAEPFTPARRPDAVYTQLERDNAGLNAEDKLAKFGKMAASPHAFFRGTNQLFWKDMANDPRLAQFGNEKTQTWVQGDLHALNFGTYFDDSGEVVYGLNDFDEAVVGDYQMDLWRMSSSLSLVGQQMGLSPDQQRGVIRAFGEGYLEALDDFRGNNKENGVFDEGDASHELDDFIEDVKDDASRKDMLKKWTDKTDGDRHFDLDKDKLEPVDDAKRKQIERAVDEYRKTLSGGIDGEDDDFFKVRDVAVRRFAGTGSLGTERYYVMIEGDSKKEGDNIILDVKLQGEPTAYKHMSPEQRSAYDADFENHAQRAVMGQRALTDNVNDLLGWTEMDGKAFTVRERSPAKDDFEPAELLDDAKDLRQMAQQWGQILAGSHARADADFGSHEGVDHSFEDAVIQTVGDREDEFLGLLEDVGVDYATQVGMDYEAFLDLVED
jgi:uncharacterized protein (DUF2252 family)